MKLSSEEERFLCMLLEHLKVWERFFAGLDGHIIRDDIEILDKLIKDAEIDYR